MEHPPIPPGSKFFALVSEEVEYRFCEAAGQQISLVAIGDWERRIIAAVAEVEWRKIADELDSRLPRALYNCTREDGIGNPCPECKKRQDARLEIHDALMFARDWRAWGEKR